MGGGRGRDLELRVSMFRRYLKGGGRRRLASEQGRRTIKKEAQNKEGEKGSAPLA